MNPRPLKARMLALLPSDLAVVRQPGNALFLTFDDGPHPVHTPRLLDTLKEHAAQATFFLIGERAQALPSIVRRIVDEGHAIANHSWNHRRFHQQPLQAQLDEIARTDRLLQQFDGNSSHDFRPPGGRLTASLMLALARQRTRIAYWSYDSMDYRQAGGRSILDTFEASPPRPGDVLLMHDDADAARQALQTALPAWKRRGYAFPSLRGAQGRAAA